MGKKIAREEMKMDTIHMAGPSITELEIETVEKAMRDWYEKPYWYCEEFQRVFAEWHGRKHALMTPNCTTSIHLILTALGVKEGDEVLVPDCTWIGSAAGISYLGATPVFCDIDPIDWCISPESIEASITDKTKAIIVVDLFGNMPRMDEIIALGEKHSIPIVEDAAEALGSVYKGTRAGKFGVASVFSFHRTKTLVTGEGGMLLLDDDELFDFCSMWRDHGRRPGGEMYYNYEVTYKYMPFNVQAAIGYAQFQRVDELVDKKRWIMNQYKERLGDIEDLQFNADPEHVTNGAWITGLVFGKSHRVTKQEAIDKLGAMGVPVRPFFFPLSSIPAYSGMQEKSESVNTVAYDISSRAVNLPGALNLTEEQIERVCLGVRDLLCG